jgi:hypothetical protein
MRTTVSINDDLLRAARSQAAAEGRTLSDLVSEALRQRLAGREVEDRERYVPTTFGKDGPLPGVDIANNAAVRDLMDGT